MKTLDYLNLNEVKVANVVASLQNLLADFQVYYTNFVLQSQQQLQYIVVMFYFLSPGHTLL